MNDDGTLSAEIDREVERRTPELLDYWQKLIEVGGLMSNVIATVGMYVRREREERDRRWADREHVQRQFHLRLGLERAQNKAHFLRKYCGLK